MIKTKLILSLIAFSSIFTAVYSFSIDEINQSIESDYNIDLQGDKVDYKFSKQDQIKKNNNGGYINTGRDSYVDSEDNLNLDNIQDPDVVDNSQQGESKDEYDSSIIPINYYENRLADIEDNIIMKKTSFRMEYYEEGAIKVRNNLQRYYNPDLSNILVGGVPSTFGFGKDSVIGTSPGDNLGIDIGSNNGILPNVDCSKTCNCGSWYNFLGQCKQIPPNSYSTGNGFKCNRGYELDSTGNQCLAIQQDETVPITDSPFEGIRYRGIEPIDAEDDPFGVNVIPGQSSQYSNVNLGIFNGTYQSIDYDFIRSYDINIYDDAINNSSYTDCLPQSSQYEVEYSYYNYGQKPCEIKKQSSIYDLQMTPVDGY